MLSEAEHKQLMALAADEGVSAASFLRQFIRREWKAQEAKLAYKAKYSIEALVGKPGARKKK